MIWPEVELSQVAKIQMGQSPPSATYNSSGEGMPFFQGKAEFGDVFPAVQKWCAQPIRIAQKGDILLSVRAPVGPTNLAPQNCCIGRGLAAIHAQESIIIQKFLLYFFKYKEPYISQKGQGSTFTAINRDEIESLRFFLPPISEQRRIVEILDQADALRKKRAKADEKAARILPALFYKMFGDPATNPKGWKMDRLDNVIDIGTQLVDPNTSEFQDLPHIGGEEIEKDAGILKKPLLVRDCNLKSNKFYFSNKHVLYSKIRPYLNKVTFPKCEGVCSADIYPLAPKDDRTFPRFIVSLLRSQAFLSFAKVHSERLRIPKLNKEQLGAFEMIIPDKELLLEYENKAEELSCLGGSRKRCSESIEKLMKTLLYRGFKGDLTSNWRKANIKQLTREMEAQAKIFRVENRP